MLPESFPLPFFNGSYELLCRSLRTGRSRWHHSCLTGGVYRADEKAFVSDVATLIFSKINVDLFFLTTCGISVERGITYQRMDEISVQNKMMEAADRTIVLADSSKAGNNSLVKMCGIEDVYMLITDSHISAEQVNAFENAGVTVVISKERKS